MRAGVLVGVAAAALTVVVACGGNTDEVTEPTTVDIPQPDVAHTFDIGGGRQMYLECSGTGAPTVVLVPGAVAAAQTWSEVSDASGAVHPSRSAVFPEVATFTRVCSYDRAGTVRGEDEFTPTTPMPQPTTPDRDVADLHALLTAAGVPGPYVLAGWSYGGPVARLYAATHPTDVSGLVLVDGMSEFLQDELSPEDFSVFLATIARDNESRVAEWADVEQVDPVTVFAQLRAAPPVPVVPVVVLSGDTFDADAFRERLPADAPPDYPETFWAAQLASQDDLAALFPDAQHITHTDSSHDIHHESPRLVIDAIRGVSGN